MAKFVDIDENVTFKDQITNQGKKRVGICSAVCLQDAKTKCRTDGKSPETTHFHV
jgi:hypothetical protein